MPSVSQRAYARMRGVHHSSVQEAIRSGRLPVGPDGRIDPAKADLAWDRDTDPGRPRATVGRKSRPGGAPQPGPSAVPPAPESLTFAKSRAVREAFLARLAELEFKRRNADLVPAESVRRLFFSAARRARDLLLALEDNLAPLVLHLDDEAVARELIRSRIDKVLEELARGGANGSHPTDPENPLRGQAGFPGEEQGV